MVNPFETRRRTVSVLVFPREKRTSLFYRPRALEFETPNLQLSNLWLGRMYDKRGNYGVPWWTNRSVEQYKDRSECMVNQYSDFSYFGKHVSTNTNHLLIKTWDKPAGLSLRFQIAGYLLLVAGEVASSHWAPSPPPLLPQEDFEVQLLALSKGHYRPQKAKISLKIANVGQFPWSWFLWDRTQV